MPKSKPTTATTLQALCRQEESHYRIRGRYLKASSNIDGKVVQRRNKCRAAMVTWCCTVVDYLEFERDTVTIALSYLDRFLETPQGQACLTTPRRFKMAGMTCLYTAIKTHEPEAIEPDLVVELSGNLCSTDDIETMERTILQALGWRVNPPTALSFCRELLALVPSRLADADALLDLAQVQTELAVHDARLITTPPSLLSLAAIFNALESKHSSLETLDDLSQLFFVALAGSKTLDMDAVFDVQDILDDIIRAQNSKSAQPKKEDVTASPTTPAKEMALATNSVAVVSPTPVRCYKAAEAA